MKVSAPLLTPILRSDVQGRLLAQIFAEPDAEHSVSELARIVDSSFPTVLREVSRAEDAGIVRTRKIGQVRLVAANVANRFYQPLRTIIMGAFGAPAVVTREFSGIEGVDALVLFGSWVARYEGERGPQPGDVDVLLIGEPNRRDVYAAAERVEAELGIEVQTTIRSAAEWDSDDPFLAEVRKRPNIVLMADSDKQEVHDLARRIMEESR